MTATLTTRRASMACISACVVAVAGCGTEVDSSPVTLAGPPADVDGSTIGDVAGAPVEVLDVAEEAAPVDTAAAETALTTDADAETTDGFPPDQPDVTAADATGLPADAGGGCKAKSACQESKPWCDLATGQCVACLHGGHCPGLGARCIAGQCAQPLPCQSTKQCLAANGVCSPTTGFCVDCNEPADCAPNQQCKANQCVAPGPKCKAAKDCAAVEGLCDAKLGACVECLAKNDCLADQDCADGLCMPLKPQEKLCTPGTEVFCLCKSGKEDGTKTCAPDGLSLGPCKPCLGAPACAPGEAKCQGAIVLQCKADQSGLVAVTDCGTKGCLDGKCQEPKPACTAGDEQCQDGALATCDGKVWQKKACDDGDLCTADSCDPVLKACVFKPAKDCGDGNPCTLDTCDGKTGQCKATAIPDGAACGGDGKCVGGVCKLNCSLGAVLAEVAVPANEYSLAFAVATAPASGALVAGTTYGKANSEDGFAIRVSAAGGVVWKKAFGGAQGERFNAAVPAKDGHLLVGFTGSKGAGSIDAWLLLVDADGGQVQEVTYGSAEQDAALAAVPLAGGGYGVAVAAMKAGKNHPELVRFGPDLAVTSKTELALEHGAASALAESAAGLTLAGSIYPPAGNPYSWIARVDSKGQPSWIAANVGSGALLSTVTLPSGDVLAAGFSPGSSDTDGRLVRIDAQGKLKWQKSPGDQAGKGRFSALAHLQAGVSLVLFGETTQGTGPGKSVGWVVTTNVDGDTLGQAWVAATPLNGKTAPPTSFTAAVPAGPSQFWVAGYQGNDGITPAVATAWRICVP